MTLISIGISAGDSKALDALFQGILPVGALISAECLVVAEIAEGLVDLGGAVAGEPEQPGQAGDEADGPPVRVGEHRDQLAGVGVFGVLGPEETGGPVVDEQPDELHEVPDVEHRAPVGDLGEERQLAGQLIQRREVALAAGPVDHRRTQDGDRKRRVRKLLQPEFRLQLAVAVAIRGLRRGVLGDDLVLADGRAVAIDDGGAHEDELADTGGLRLPGGLDGQLCIDLVVECLPLLRNLAGVGMGDARHVIDRVVAGEGALPPRAVDHVDGIHAILLWPLREVLFERGADVAVGAGDQDATHGWIFWAFRARKTAFGNRPLPLAPASRTSGRWPQAPASAAVGAGDQDASFRGSSLTAEEETADIADGYEAFAPRHWLCVAEELVHKDAGVVVCWLQALMQQFLVFWGQSSEAIVFICPKQFWEGQRKQI